MVQTGGKPASDILFNSCDEQIISLCGINVLEDQQNVCEMGRPIPIYLFVQPSQSTSQQLSNSTQQLIQPILANYSQRPILTLPSTSSHQLLQSISPQSNTHQISFTPTQYSEIEYLTDEIELPISPPPITVQQKDDPQQILPFDNGTTTTTVTTVRSALNQGDCLLIINNNNPKENKNIIWINNQ